MYPNLPEWEIGIQILDQSIILQDRDTGQGRIIRLLRQQEVHEPVVQLQGEGVVRNKVSKRSEKKEILRRNCTECLSI